MPRIVLALLLCLFASHAMAGGTAPNNSESCPPPKAAKANPSNAATSDTDSTTTVHTDSAGPVTHARAAAPHVSTPRWHSLLPGMFR
ncbi:MAG TPA: hypothetical protein VKM35_13425 [Arenimonas sp.]|uniref:hypothetical protein n=1 Tax=Arenimonas sp. TaxID=1872635 RepID=UPI002C89F994|nr:hypothetical protein [Arenimonas sp.]HMB58194.1 hypothetical protein [Arenimonas sp.]